MNELPAEILALPGRLDAIGAAITEIRLQLAGLRTVDDRIDRVEELITALARQLTGAGADAPGETPTVDQKLDELSRTVAQLVDGVRDDVRQAAADAANTVGVAAAEASIAAAEAAGEAILSDQDAKLAGLGEAITAIEASLGRRATEALDLRTAVGELSPMIESVGRSVEELADVVQELGGAIGEAPPVIQTSDDTARLSATTEELAIRVAGLASQLDAMAQRSAAPAAPVDLSSAPDLEGLIAAATDQIATEVAVAGQQAVQAIQSAGQGLTASALASLERATMNAQTDVERATDSALETLLASVDARLAAAVDAAREEIRDALADATPPSAGRDLVVAPSPLGTPDADAIADLTMAAAEHITEQIAAQLEDSTTGVLHDAVLQAVDRAIEVSIAPTILTAGRDIADAVAALSAEAAEAAATDIEAVTAATAEAVERAAESIEDTIRQTLSVREVHVERSGDGAEMTSALMSAVAESLDQFSARVQTDLDQMGERMNALAKVLESLVEDTMSRRRGEPGSALDTLRQVAAEATPAPKPRRRTSKRA